MSRLKKTILNIEVNDKEFHIQYNGTIMEPQTKEQCKHNERLMRMLVADEDVFNFFYNIIEPVVRFKKREARKAKKCEQGKTR